MRACRAAAMIQHAARERACFKSAPGAQKMLMRLLLLHVHRDRTPTARAVYAAGTRSAKICGAFAHTSR